MIHYAFYDRPSINQSISQSINQSINQLIINYSINLLMKKNLLGGGGRNSSSCLKSEKKAGLRVKWYAYSKGISFLLRYLMQYAIIIALLSLSNIHVALGRAFSTKWQPIARSFSATTVGRTRMVFPTKYGLKSLRKTHNQSNQLINRPDRVSLNNKSIKRSTSWFIDVTTLNRMTCTSVSIGRVRVVALDSSSSVISGCSSTGGYTSSASSGVLVASRRT